jgi:hypothetical protein
LIPFILLAEKSNARFGRDSPSALGTQHKDSSLPCLLLPLLLHHLVRHHPQQRVRATMNNYEQLPTQHLHPWQSPHEGHALPHTPGLLPYTQDGHQQTSYNEQRQNTQQSWNTSQDYQPQVVLSSSTPASQEVYWRYPTSPSLDIDAYNQQYTTSYPAQTTSHYAIQTAYSPIGKIDTSASQLERALGPTQPTFVTQQTQAEANQYSSAVRQIIAQSGPSFLTRPTADRPKF